MGEYAEYWFDQQGWYGMFVACGILCLADVSSVSPSSEADWGIWPDMTEYVKDDRTKLLLKLLIPWSSFVKTIAVYLKQKLKEQNFCDVSSDAMCLLLECWKSQPFLREIAIIKFSWMETFCSMEVELTWMGLWNGALEGQLLFNERGISGGWRSGQKALDMWANCALKHCLSLKNFIPNFVAFFGIIRNLISCVRRMSFSVTSAKRVCIY